MKKLCKKYKEDSSEVASGNNDELDNAGSNEDINTSFNTFAFNIMANYVEITDDVSAAQPEEISIAAEMTEYSEEPIVSINVDVLLWWSERKMKLPTLSKLARFAFSIPASSAAPERNFSTAGSVLSEKRTRLSVSLLEDILICKSNMDLIDGQFNIND